MKNEIKKSGINGNILLEYNMVKQPYYIRINQKCYDTLADEYYSKPNGFVVGKHIAETTIEKFESQNNIEKNDPRIFRILEIGAGTGTVLAALNNNLRYELYAIDFSKKMAEYVKINCPRTENHIAIRDILSISDISTIFEGVDKFDIFFMAAFIHLFPYKDAVRLLRRINNWLNPNGLVYIDTTKEDKFKAGEISEKEGYSIKVWRLRTRWTEERFERLLNDCNFITVYRKNHEAHNGKIWLRRVIKKGSEQ